MTQTNTKSPYCKAVNCTDLADVKCGIDEVNYLIRIAIKQNKPLTLLRKQLYALIVKEAKFLNN